MVSVLRSSHLISSFLFLGKHTILVLFFLFLQQITLLSMGRARISWILFDSYFPKESSKVCPYSFAIFFAKQIIFLLHFVCPRYPKAIYNNEFQIWTDGSLVGNHVRHYIFKASLHPALKLKSILS